MYYSTGEYSLNCSRIFQRYILEILPLGVKPVERDYIAKMIHYMCCNSSMLSKRMYTLHIPCIWKSNKSYITDIDAREFKEFDDELDVDVVKRRRKIQLFYFKY